MKKFLSVALAAMMVIPSLTGCSDETTVSSDDTLNIVTTIFPAYDWTNQILGEQAENANVSMLLDSGVDLHSYQASADDIITISNCDMFIYVGGESDAWVEDVLAQTTNENLITVNLMDVLGDSVKEEEIIEGMEHEHKEGEDLEEEHEEEASNDEHVWLSLKNAKTICDYLAQELAELDAENASAYLANAESYIAELDALDTQYQSVVGEAAFDTLLFADRFPFRYLVDDYALDYFAAFPGCSSETEASFETIIFLADKIDELGLTSVMTIEASGSDIADTVIKNTETADQTVLSLNSMQSVTADNIEDGATYISIMEDNLNVLKEALN